MALLLGEIVRRQARHRPERSAYVIGPERVTYRRLNAMANRLAHALRALGVGRGDRVATLAENRVEYPAIYFALAKLGAIHVPVNFRYRAGEVRYVLAQSEAKVLLHAERFAATVEEVRGALPALAHVISLDRDAPELMARASDAEPAPDPALSEHDPHVMLYTSGTTGDPKGALLSHRTYVLQAMQTQAASGLGEDNVDLRVVDADDRDVGAGATGEIVCRSEFTMLGYWRMPDATAQALRGGWLHTGDLGAFDDEGLLHIAGRLKEMIKCGGESIFPVEVERCLLDHPGIAEAAVFGVPDPDWGGGAVA